MTKENWISIVQTIITASGVVFTALGVLVNWKNLKFQIQSKSVNQQEPMTTYTNPVVPSLQELKTASLKSIIGVAIGSIGVIFSFLYLPVTKWTLAIALVNSAVTTVNLKDYFLLRRIIHIEQ